MTHRVQIENSYDQNDDKRHSENGKVQHDCPLIKTLFILSFTHENLEISMQTDNSHRYHVNMNCRVSAASRCSTPQTGWQTNRNRCHRFCCNTSSTCDITRCTSALSPRPKWQLLYYYVIKCFHYLLHNSAADHLFKWMYVHQCINTLVLVRFHML